MGRLGLYFVGVYGLLAAFVIYMNRKNAHGQLPVGRMASQLRDAWADNHTRT
ncbi:MAG TPA: hypothetical protein VKB38_04365 [Terracidiphilus sp.]|nr:hypothetical protein [Terracidiphilus sp.]